MSVFRVKLNNVGQGLLDKDVNGVQVSTSKQRQVFVMGPKKVNRLLKDGDTFTDCNYWKRFAYPQVAYDQAIVEVLSDDGSIYSDVESENTFAVGATYASVTTAYSTDNTLNFVTAHGGPAHYLQITNLDGSRTLTVELNGNTDATITLAANEVQIFNTGDLAISQIRMKANSNGGSGAGILAAVKAAVNS